MCCTEGEIKNVYLDLSSKWSRVAEITTSLKFSNHSSAFTQSWGQNYTISVLPPPQPSLPEPKM